MKISKKYITKVAQRGLKTNPLYAKAYNEVVRSASKIVWPKRSKQLIVNNSQKNNNGVTPLKDPFYKNLEEKYNWYREKSLKVLKEKKKGGPIDAYKVFKSADKELKVGLEFETGNISSTHRSMNKLLLGLDEKELDLAIIIFPVKDLAFCLTDRVANYEELEPYFETVTKGTSFIFI